MKQLTAKTRKGTQFEVFLQDLLIALGYRDVVRNVVYLRKGDRKPNHRFKPYKHQVDVVYRGRPGENLFGIVEAKYTDSGTYGWTQTDEGNLVEKLLQYKLDLNADIAVLATNVSFPGKIRYEASMQNGIIVMERPQLQALHKKTGGTGTIEDAVSRINLDEREMETVYRYV